jgi:hypothetical protein
VRGSPAYACPSPEPISVVFVLGMHRSGTSALAGVLDRLGLSFGRVLRTPVPANDRGLFENPAVFAFNEALIGPWTAPSLATPDSTHEEFLHNLLRDHGQQRLGMKDPRFLFSLPAWLPHVEECFFVATVRHPLEVTASLLSRDRMVGWNLLDEDTALHMWAIYNERLLALRERVSFPILNFSAAPSAYLSKLRQLVEACGLAFDEAAAGQSIAGSLVHHRSDTPPPSEVAELYRRLLELSEEAVTPLEALTAGAAAPLAPPDGERQESLTVARRLWYLDHLALAQLSRLHSAPLETLAAYEREISRRQGVLDEAVSVRDAEIRRLQAALDDAVSVRDAEIGRLQAALDDAVSVRDAEIGRLQAVLEEAVSVRDAEIRRMRLLTRQEPDSSA